MSDCVTLKVPVGEVGDIIREFGKKRIGKVKEVVEHLDKDWMRAVVEMDREEDAIRYKALVRKRWRMILYTERVGCQSQESATRS